MSTRSLLQVGVPPIGTDQRIKNCQNVPAILDHAREDVAEMRFALRVLVPLGENRRRNRNVAAEFFRGMPTQEQTVKESRFALRKCEIRNHFGRKHWCNRRHSENAVYPKLCPRQVGHRFQCRVAVKTPWMGCNGTGLDRF